MCIDTIHEGVFKPYFINKDIQIYKVQDKSHRQADRHTHTRTHTHTHTHAHTHTLMHMHTNTGADSKAMSLHLLLIQTSVKCGNKNFHKLWEKRTLRFGGKYESVMMFDECSENKVIFNPHENIKS